MLVFNFFLRISGRSLRVQVHSAHAVVSICWQRLCHTESSSRSKQGVSSRVYLQQFSPWQLTQTNGCALMHVCKLLHMMYVLIEPQVLVFSHAEYLDGVCEWDDTACNIHVVQWQYCCSCYSAVDKSTVSD